MGRKQINVGLVIADIDEYVHIEKAFKGISEPCNAASLTGHKVLIKGEKNDIILRTVCSGIGKVNATAAATMIAADSNILLNAGLSGGFGDAKTHDFVLGTEFYEHDFDLSALGYEFSVKPGNEGVLVADEALNNDILKKFPYVKKGAFVTGDSFICSEEKHNNLKARFNPIACDMESAAIAHVAKIFNIPYVSVRMVSDGADDSSTETYRDSLFGECANGWLELVLGWLKTL